MIYHFANIVTWDFFQVNIKKDNQLVFVDGFLLQALLFFRLGIKVKKISGLNYYHNNLIHSNSLYLTFSGNEGFANEEKLPDWFGIEDVSLPNDLFIRIEQSNLSQIILGISSPKQDKLAMMIHEKFPDKHIYCLGAAIYSRRYSTSENVVITFTTMLLNNPKRTLKKLVVSLKLFLTALSGSRYDVEQFSQVLAPIANNHA